MNNLRAALRWSLASADLELAARLAGALGRFWCVRGYLTEGDRWCAEVLTQPSRASAEMHARALNAANLAGVRGDRRRATALHERALRLRRTGADRAGISQSLLNLGAVAMLEGDLALAHERL
jgi:hypothetical protein